MVPKLNKNQGVAKALKAVWLGLALFLAMAPAPARAGQAVFKPLAAYLEASGMPKGQVKRLLNSPRLKFEAKLLSRLLARPEKSLDYAQFLTKTNVKRAREFARRHKELLEDNQRASGVPGSVVVAILTIESGLGSYTGRANTMSVLASQAVLDTKKARKLLYPYWPAKQRAYFRSREFGERLQKRAAWARDEVVALLKLAAQRRVSPYSFQGSLAGALGMCQFVPSSVLKHGTDGDNNGLVDLNDPVDAVHSVGVYLKNHGWRQGMNRAEQLEIIRTYNKSWPYANTVLDLAARL
jgi:membrane-bound lytic murein transglycosylase B